MNTKKAAKELGVFILQNKKEIIALLNRLGLSSLPNDVRIDILNKEVLYNLPDKRFEEGLKDIANDEYEYAICAGVCAVIIAVVVVASTATGVVLANQRARRERSEVFRDNLRSRYLTQEQLNEIAIYEMQVMQREMLLSQAEYLQKEENLVQAQREDLRKNTLYIVIGGILTVVVGSILIKRYE